MAIHDSSPLREIARQWSQERFIPWSPEALGHQASTVRADIPRNGLFGITRLICGCEVDGRDRGEALLYSSFQKQLTTTERWSKNVHRWDKSPESKQLCAESRLPGLPPCFYTTEGGEDNRGKDVFSTQGITLVPPDRPALELVTHGPVSARSAAEFRACTRPGFFLRRHTSDKC